MTTHLLEHSRCLSQFFEVIELLPDCDYDEVCDRHQPDLVLFESGVDSAERSIRNTSAHPHVPKIGFLNADSIDAARATFISDMAEWGVETYFTHSLAMGEHTPEIADRLFVWPNFVDPEIFHDYGLEKVVPILLTGNQTGFYPWRNAVARVVSAHFPTMICPHFGWHAGSESRRMLIGEQYARLLNASIFAPACGSVAKDLLRKHLEIPASGACLVTERSAALEDMGFRDMENCVFATPEDVVEKLDILLADQQQLNRIVRAGHDLVHSHHTMAQRSQIRQWFDLNSRLKPGEKIVQDGPIGPLRIVSGRARPSNNHAVSGALDCELVAKGWRAIEAGSSAAAKSFFLRCLNHAVIPEALVGLAYCHLLNGDAEAAKERIDGWLDVTFRQYGCKEPDPVAWATGIRIALCRGKLREAMAMASRFPALKHRELDRICSLLGVHVDRAGDTRVPRASIAPPPDQGEREWQTQLLLMLRACGQRSIATAIETGRAPPPKFGKERLYEFRPSKRRVAPWRRVVSLLPDNAKTRLRRLKKAILENDWTSQVEKLISCEPASRALILEPSSLSRGQRAFKRSLRKNPWLPDLVEIRSAIAAGNSSPALRPGDIVYVTARAARVFDLSIVVETASVVLVDGANLPGGQKLTEVLSGNADFSLILHDGRDKIGYAIFRRRSPQLAWANGALG
ncbi:MAG TPA: glycosyltransferase [Devosiaceae bacterium]|nr:glycosyltransferase [Devosiaceae bacterium]